MVGTRHQAMYLEAGPHQGLTGAHGGATQAVVMGRHGVVSTAHWLASQEALRVLQDGGNAFDAAVCGAAVVSIAEPFMSGVGGVGAAVTYHCGSGECKAIDFHGFAPAAATPDQWSKQEDLIDGVRGALVPGVVAGWSALVERYGTMDLKRLLRPAIEWAAAGVPVSILCAYQIASNADRLRQSKASAEVFLPNDIPLRAGQLLVQPRLSETLAAIAQDGADVFYDGPLAAALVDACAKAGGMLSRADLAAGRTAEWGAPAKCRYRGYIVNTLPPPFASFQLLETLRLLDGFDLRNLEYQSADHLHLFVEAVKQARTDRVSFLGHQTDADYADLLSDDHIDSKRARISATRAGDFGSDWYTDSTNIKSGSAAATAPSHTTNLVTADAEGNFVSLTQTLGWLFGGGVILGETGVLLNDKAYWFDLDPDSPNVIGPRKRVASPLAPVVILNADEGPWMGVGTPGSHGILQTTAQMISNMVDFDLNPQAAVEAPRIRVDENRCVAVESRIPRAVTDDLAIRGHECHFVGDWMYAPQEGRADLGRGSIAARDEASTTLLAGSDPRGDGLALAY